MPPCGGQEADKGVIRTADGEFRGRRYDSSLLGGKDRTCGTC